MTSPFKHREAEARQIIDKARNVKGKPSRVGYIDDRELLVLEAYESPVNDEEWAILVHHVPFSPIQDSSESQDTLPSGLSRAHGSHRPVSITQNGNLEYGELTFMLDGKMDSYKAGKLDNGKLAVDSEGWKQVKICVFKNHDTEKYVTLGCLYQTLRENQRILSQAKALRITYARAAEIMKSYTPLNKLISK